MKGPKTLYVSDLDGTLLRRDQTVSPFTAETINTLTARHAVFLRHGVLARHRENGH